MKDERNGIIPIGTAQKIPFTAGLEIISINSPHLL